MLPELERLKSSLPFRRCDIPLVLGVNDRQGRALIENGRRNGLMIMSPDYNNQFYRLAETDSEKQEYLESVYQRAIGYLVEYGAAIKACKLDGQQVIGNGEW